MVIQPIIDADILCYEIGFATQNKGDDGIPFSVSVEEIQNTLEKRIENILTDLAFDLVEEVEMLKPVLFLTGKDNFRFQIAKQKPYKGNRMADKPLNYKYIKAYLITMYGAEVVDGMEADDAMRILSVKLRETSDVIPVICSRDKDLKQAEGYVYSWETSIQKREITLVEGIGSLSINEKGKVNGCGLKFLYYQILVGDTTDNYGGCPRIGSVKAYKILSDAESEEEMQRLCLDTYIKAYKCDEAYARERMEEQAKLAYILERDGEMWKWLVE